MRGQLQSARILTYALAGNAIITLHNPATGGRFTYKIRAPNKRSEATIRFVSVLCGPENTKDYRYIGFIKMPGEFRHGGDKSSVSVDAPSFRAFAWFWKNAPNNLGKLEVYHEGRCGMCGRKLTVPSSVSSGVGPECSSRLGIAV